MKSDLHCKRCQKVTEHGWDGKVFRAGKKVQQWACSTCGKRRTDYKKEV